VNSQIATGGVGQSAGIGFAIPVDTVEQVARQLIEHGQIDRAYLGVSTVALTPELAQRLGLDVQSGALVQEVAPGSPADEAGLQAGSTPIAGQFVAGGDIIVSVDGTEIESPEDIADAIGDNQPGDRVEIRYYRDDEERTATVALANRPNDVVGDQPSLP
jgi:S1-C subfamily serine protease